MKYVDYPIPNNELIETLSKAYCSNNVCALSNLEEQAQLNELRYKIELSNKFLEKFKRMGAKETQQIFDVNKNHLSTLASLGANKNTKIESSDLGNNKTCFLHYLKCEIEILKALMFLIFLDNLQCNKQQLVNMANERMNVVISCVL